jgi:methyl-accepting chemotaxis protein
MRASGFGRFDQSFIFHMIRDFFALLLVVAAAEMGIRYAVLLYDFRTNEPARVDRSAQALAEDVKSIMLNSGGPLAAQTVYPILNRNYDDLGLAIAVLPSEVTVESMKATFKLQAKGLAPNWPVGEHMAATASLKAEQFCLGCHVKAQVGDVLGTVTVRSYLARKEAVWWQEVRLTAGALSIKIVAHTLLLLLLLRVRMEPLMSLRATVASLSKGVMNLSPRARVKSEDEFGELAGDLNHFLDRIATLVHDLDKILGEVVAVGTRLGSVTRGLEQQFDHLRLGALGAAGEQARRSLEAQVTAARESGAFDALLATLDRMAAHAPPASPPPGPWQAHLAELKQHFEAVRAALQTLAPPLATPQAQADGYQAFAQSLREMAVLEATMQSVAESGRRVLQQLERGRAGAEAP